VNQSVKDYLSIWGIVSIWMLCISAYFFVPSPYGAYISCFGITIPAAIFFIVLMKDDA